MTRPSASTGPRSPRRAGPGDADIPAPFADAARTLGISADGVHADTIAYSGSGYLRAALPVSRLATASISLVALTLSELARRLGHPDAQRIAVDRRLCDTWFGRHVTPVGWEAPAVWNPLSAAFPTRDGSWIRTHANARRHRTVLLHVLGCAPERDAVAAAVATWDAVDLETAVIDAGGAAAALRSRDAWERSAPGRAVASEPLIQCERTVRFDGPTAWDATPQAPLRGVRVLDLTRVIAGPACTQVLAGLGADVLRIDPPDWDEPAVLPLVMGNKRSARLDAATPAELDRLRGLVAGADVIVHGYRAGALTRLGLGDAERARLRPGLVEVAERAYGWSGPWAQRRGFDSLVQFAAGIAHTGMTAAGTAQPVSLPVQALDWATGYLAAAAVLAGLARRWDDGQGSIWRLSLARTAHLLQTISPDAEARTPDLRANRPGAEIAAPAAVAPGAQPRVVHTRLGDIVMAPSPLCVGTAALAYTRIATSLGADPAEWLTR